MSSLVLLLLVMAILVVLAGLIAGPLWWLQRPIPVTRATAAPVPLFIGTHGSRRTPGSRSGTDAASDAFPSATTMVEGDVVRFAEPSGSSRPLLNGAFEILSGPDVGRTIRFARWSVADADVFSFGRAEGPAYRHVQLRDGLAGRRHARLRHEQGRWTIETLSVDHPVMRNMIPLSRGEAHPLSDGDHLTMGTTLFRFRLRTPDQLLDAEEIAELGEKDVP